MSEFFMGVLTAMFVVVMFAIPNFIVMVLVGSIGHIFQVEVMQEASFLMCIPITILLSIFRS